MAGKRPISQASDRLVGGVAAAAPAKINRFLHITGRREDGFHNIETGFQFLDWHDVIHIRQCSIPGVHMIDDPMGLGNKNLVARAAHLLLTGTSLGCEIVIEKNLPSGAGIGGGSSDCATTLALIDNYFNLKHSSNSLKRLGFRLGKDIPLFLYGASCFASGLGEILESESWPGQIVLLAYPRIHVSTHTIFQHPNLKRDTQSQRVRSSQLQITRNDCETVVRELYPSIDQLFKVMSVFGEPRLTGSGGCVFVVDPYIGAGSPEIILKDYADVYQGLLRQQSMLYTRTADM